MIYPWVVVIWVDSWSFLEKLHIRDLVGVLLIVEGSSESGRWVKNMGEISHVANVGVNHWVKSVYLLWSWVSALGSFTFSGELNEVFVIESSVGLGDLWVKSVNLVWLRVSGGIIDDS